MRVAAGIATALATLAAAAPAQGVTLVAAGTPDIDQKAQTMAARFRVPTVTMRLWLSREPCPPPGAPTACMQYDTATIHLPASEEPRFDLAHELGHAFDRFAFDDAGRAAFLRIIGQPDRPWQSPPNSPHEQFAEAYSLCAIHPRHITFDYPAMGYDYGPTLRTHERACRLIRSYSGSTRNRGV